MRVEEFSRVGKFLTASLIALLLCSPSVWAATAPGKTVVPAPSEIDDEEDDGSGPLEELEPSPEESAAATNKPNPTRTDTSPIPEGQRRSSASGEKIFDWSKHQGESQVEHPLAGKGLIRITKDKTYIYKVSESEQRQAASFRVGMFDPKNLENPEQEGNSNATFESNYDNSSSPQILFDYEWQLWASAIGKFGVRAGSGLFVAQGHGHFSSATNSSLTPRENFTFIGLPNSLGAVYRMQLWHKQLLVPYGDGGLTAWTFSEIRDDNKDPKFGGALAAYLAAGTAFNLTYFDALSRLALDREYGINAIYLTVEYRNMIALSQKFDFSGDFINAGFLMEF